jgi:tRNA-specific 2-thiouridylase
VHSLSFIGDPITTPCRIECRVRYRDPRVACEFTPEVGDTALIKFESPQRALASGQILALYDGDKLLGGGVFA